MSIVGLHIFTAIATAAMIVTTSTAIYWTFFDTKSPVHSVSVTVKDALGNEAHVFRRGDTMLVNRENCTTKNVHLTVTRALVRGDGVSYPMEPGFYTMEKGCETTERGVIIPRYIEPGKYEYWVTFAYENNAFYRGQLLLKVPTIEVLP